MYKIIVALLFWVIATSTAWAGYIGLPTALDREEWFPINGIVDFYEKQIKDNTGTRLYHHTTYSFMGVAQLAPHVNITGQVGFTSTYTTGYKSFEMSPSIYYGLGIKIKLAELTKQGLSFGTGLLFYNLDNRDEINNTILYYREFNYFLGCAYSLNKYVRPYGGVLISKVSGDIQQEGESKYSIEEDIAQGAFLGTEIYINHHLDLGFEARAFSETAFSFFCNYYLTY